jgi:plasmid maintenance system antidote protein VapI
MLRSKLETLRSSPGRIAHRREGPALSALSARPVCRHCEGSGREPGPLKIEFSRSGDARGEQQRAADATGISAAMISAIFSGERTGSIDSFIRLARYYRTTVDRLIQTPAIRARIRESSAAQTQDQQQGD